MSRTKPIIDKDGNHPPQRVNRSEGSAWWYGLQRGLEFIHEIRVDGMFVRTDTFIIPIGQIKKYISAVESARRTR